MEVMRRDLIHWNGEPVSGHLWSSSIRDRSRPGRGSADGVILRQEVPFPLVRLVLDDFPIRPSQQPARDRPDDRVAGSATKLFGNKRAVDRLDLKVRPGELFAFLGPNGAGKTTTIKTSPALAPTAGSVRVGGMTPRLAKLGNLLGYVPDQPDLQPS